MVQRLSEGDGQQSRLFDSPPTSLRIQSPLTGLNDVGRKTISRPYAFLSKNYGFWRLVFHLAILICSLPACKTNEGWVELDWVFVDDSHSPVFPGGYRKNTCGLLGAEEPGELARLKYDLSVRLNLYACDSTANPNECLNNKADHSALFNCDRARGTLGQVLAQDSTYLVEIQIIAVVDQGSRFVVGPNCIAVPGPRFRRVQGGAITDLAVYELILRNGLQSSKTPMVFSSCRERFDQP